MTGMWVRMPYHFLTFPIPCVTRYGYFQVSQLLGEKKSALHLRVAFRPTTAISSVTTRLLLTRSSHGSEIMMGKLVFPLWCFNSSREMLKTSFEGSGMRPSYPKSIAGLEVTSVVDLTLGYDSTNPPTY